VSVRALLDWYKINKRPLPWRTQPADPYKIWISEIMSQQSTIKMMLPFYEKWMQRYPHIKSLAATSENDLLKMWEGLGYYSRARNILKAAKIIQKQKSFPHTYEQLLELPGVGPYTAAAIASIAFGEAKVPMDGNVIRVLSRYVGIQDPLNKAHDKLRVFEVVNNISELIKELTPLERGDASQAFMELGATLCKPAQQMNTQYCEVCPLSSGCFARKNQQVMSLPQVKQRQKMKKISRLLIIYRDPEGSPLLRRRSEENSVLGGQWELPFWDFEESPLKSKSEPDWIAKSFLPHFETHKGFKHTIMSTEYNVWWVEAGRIKKALPGHAFLDQLKEAPLTSITRKALGPKP